MENTQQEHNLRNTIYGIDEGLRKQGQPAEKITWIPNGVDLDLYESPRQDSGIRQSHNLGDKFLCVYVGGMGPVRNVATLVETANLLRTQEDIHFLLVGDGGEKPALVRKATELGLANITFLDPVSKEEVPGILSAADVCVYSLRRDPFFKEPSLTRSSTTWPASGPWSWLWTGSPAGS